MDPRVSVSRLCSLRTVQDLVGVYSCAGKEGNRDVVPTTLEDTHDYRPRSKDRTWYTRKPGRGVEEALGSPTGAVTGRPETTEGV